MGTGYSRTPVLLKGALIRFDAPLLIPIPNIIIFQYNPETLSRTLVPHGAGASAASASEDSSGNSASPATSASQRAQPYDPQESFSLNLILDAADALETPESHPVAFISGVADRIAALEMLLYPITEGVQLLGSISASLGGASLSLGGAAGSEVPQRNVPVTLFVWGPGRIVPVRVTSFSVEEQAFSPLLYPIRATVAVGLTVLPPSAFQVSETYTPTPIEQFAIGAYKFTMVQKQVLATANLANSVESIINMLPF